MRELTEKADLAREFKKLTEHPSWPTLRAVFAKERERMERATARKVLAGTETADPIDQRVIDYRRGWMRGVQAVLDAPDLAILNFEKALNAEEKRGTGRV